MTLTEYVIEDSEKDAIQKKYSCMLCHKALVLIGEQEYIHKYIEAKIDFDIYFDFLREKYFQDYQGFCEVNYDECTIKMKEGISCDCEKF